MIYLFDAGQIALGRQKSGKRKRDQFFCRARSIFANGWRKAVGKRAVNNTRRGG
jgi:hypothetical protein